MPENFGRLHVSPTCKRSHTLWGNDETCKVNFYSIQTHRFLSPRPLSTPPSSIRSSVMIQPPWISRDRGSWADAPSSHALSPGLPSWLLLTTTLPLFSTAEPSSQRKLEPAQVSHFAASASRFKSLFLSDPEIPSNPRSPGLPHDLDRSGVADSRIRLRFQLAPRIIWDGAGCWELGAGVGCPESSISAREKVDARRERPLGDLGGPTSSADARRREVRTQVRGRAGIDGEMIHSRRSEPRGGAPGTP